jgi:hypothetical protein
MKHIKLYESFEGNPLPDHVDRIDKENYHIIVSSGQIDLSPEERITLDGVCKLIKFSEWIIPTNKLFFTMAKETTTHTYMKPLAVFGKAESDGRIQYTLCTYTEYGFNKDSYYVADTLEPLLQVALVDMKAQDRIEWAKIR